jgi:hypothetical protein
VIPLHQEFTTSGVLYFESMTFDLIPPHALITTLGKKFGKYLPLLIFYAILLF